MPLPVSTVGIEVPNDFPAVPYDAVHARVISAPRHADSQYHYGGAWNAIVYRFVACGNQDDTFTHSIRTAGTSPGFPERYYQEEALFSFFVQGLSVIESFFYGLYWLGSMADPVVFPIVSGSDLETIKVDRTMRKFEQLIAGGPLIDGFRHLQVQDTSGNWRNTKEYKEWKAVRNILAHRAAYGRVLNAGTTGGAQVDDLWKVENLPINDQLTSTRRLWLASTLNELLEGAKDFACARL